MNGQIFERFTNCKYLTVKKVFFFYRKRKEVYQSPQINLTCTSLLIL